MHTVSLKGHGELKAKEILLGIVKHPTGGQGRGVTTLDDMRRDIRLLDRLEPALDGASVDLEDEDWKRLCEKVRAFPFGISDRGLLSICDAVLDAPEKASET